MKVVRSELGGFKIVTKLLGFIVGTRLDKGRGIYPECSNVGTDLETAKRNMIIWDNFIELQQKEVKSKSGSSALIKSKGSTNATTLI